LSAIYQVNMMCETSYISTLTESERDYHRYNSELTITFKLWDADAIRKRKPIQDTQPEALPE